MNDAVTIGMAATAVGTVLWFLVKMMIDDFKQSVKRCREQAGQHHCQV